ncbi:MAG: hypothetical protein QY304_02105 [Candidatus Paceibacterota bacterium]|nr:MAG: hypothetical protein QY304_02105 [Candidatus Paceibacterota bacterium]
MKKKEELINGIEEALKAEMDPDLKMRELFIKILKEGYDRKQLESDVTEYMLFLRKEGREKDEDWVLEALDYLTGFCSPHMKI